jgi:hypothetical protein
MPNKYIAGLLAIILAGVNQAPSRSAVAVAQDHRDVFFYSIRPTLSEAFSNVLQYCGNGGGRNCIVVNTNNSGGFGAVAQSRSRYGVAAGYDSQADANRAALRSCSRNTPDYDPCTVTLNFYDSNP